MGDQLRCEAWDLTPWRGFGFSAVTAPGAGAVTVAILKSSESISPSACSCATAQRSSVRTTYLQQCQHTVSRKPPTRHRWPQNSLEKLAGSLGGESETGFE